jgi:MFS family permease
MTVSGAARRFALISFLSWLPTGLFIPVLVLLLLDRGVSLTAVAALGVAYSVTIMVLELPTGGLADVVGRRPLIIASAAASLVALLLLGLAESILLLVASSILRGVGRALGSGPVEAWFVDTVQARSEVSEAELSRGLSFGFMASAVALAVGTVAGALIPFALHTSLAVPVLIAAACDAVRLVVTIFAMPEPKYAPATVRSVLSGVPAAIATGLRLGVRTALLIRILVTAAGMMAALAVVELLTPAWMGELAGSPDRGVLAYGLVAAVGFAADAAGSGLSMRLTRRLRSVRAVCLVGFSVSVFSLACLAVATAVSGLGGILAAGGAYLLMFVGLGIVGGPMAQLLHSQVAAAERATVVSVQSLIGYFGGAVGAVALGQLAVVAGMAVAFGVSAVLLAVPGWLLVTAATSAGSATSSVAGASSRCP